MLELLFTILMFVVFIRVMIIAVKTTWSLAKIVIGIIILPITLIVLLLGGMIYLAFPILVVIGLMSLLCRE